MKTVGATHPKFYPHNAPGVDTSCHGQTHLGTPDKTSQGIKERILNLCPALQKPSGNSNRDKGTGGRGEDEQFEIIGSFTALLKSNTNRINPFRMCCDCVMDCSTFWLFLNPITKGAVWPIFSPQKFRQFSIRLCARLDI